MSLSPSPPSSFSSCYTSFCRPKSFPALSQHIFISAIVACSLNGFDLETIRYGKFQMGSFDLENVGYGNARMGSFDLKIFRYRKFWERRDRCVTFFPFFF